jgi:hypothetical protein
MVRRGIGWALVAGLMAMALVASGCGSGGETTASLSRSQFIKQANAMCKRQEEDRNAVIRAAIEGRDQSKVLPLAQREKVILEILPPYEEVPEKLEAMGPPEGDDGQVEAIIEAMEQAAREVKANPGAALKSTKQFFQANKLSSEYGLTECVV